MLELKNISKVYNNSSGTNIAALHGVNIKLCSSGLTFICGPSGSGKSTLLNILAGLDTPSGGQILVNGVDIKRLGSAGLDGYRNNHIGIVYQDFNLLDHLTLRENVALAIEIQGKPIDDEAITVLFNKLGLAGLENRFPTEVSGGQAQRVAIARVLIKKPKILFTDELTSNLDNEQRDEIYKLLKKLSGDVLIVATTHSREMVDKHADRVITLESGGIVSDVFKSEEVKKKVSKEKPSGEFQFEKTALPFKRALGMAWQNFCTNKFRTVFTILLSVLAITFFAMTMSLSMLTHDRAIINSFIQSGQAYITFTDDARIFTPEDRQRFIQHGDRMTDIHRYTALVYHVGPGVLAEFETHNIFAINKLAILDEGTTTAGRNKFGQTLVAGSWSVRGTGVAANAIVISDFMATQLLTTGEFDSFEGVNGIIGEEIEFNDGLFTYTVVGIYKTSFRDYFVMDGDLFALRNVTTPINSLEQLTLRPNLSQAQRFQATYFLQNDWVTGFVGGLGFLTGLTSFTTDMAASGFFITDHRIGGVPSGIWPSNEQLVNAPLFRSIRDNGLTIVRGPDGSFQAYVSSDLYSDLDSTQHFVISRRIENLDAVYDAINPGEQALSQTVIRYAIVHNPGPIGIVEDGALGPGNIMVLPPFLYDDIMSSLVLPSTSLIVANGLNYSQYSAILSRMGGETHAIFKDARGITEFVDNFGNATTVLMTIAIILGMFAIFLMYSYIAMSIRAKRKNIAIIRGLGARTRDIYRVFLIEATILALFIVLGTWSLIAISIAVGNLSVSNSSGYTLALFTTGFWFYFIILMSTALVIYLSYLVPATKFARTRNNRGVIEALKTKVEN